MRPIDADALERQIQEAYCAECDDYNGIRCRACSINDALIQVDAVPTVDAIQVEWLEAHKTEYLEDWGEEPVTVEAALRIWQKEQEAR